MVLVLLHFIFTFTVCSAVIFPTLNEGDVVVSDVTSHSALLTWRQELISEYNNTSPLRLFLLVEINDNAPIYMNPDDDDPYCSLRLSQCHLQFLTSGTQYNVVLTIDEYGNDKNDLLGEAKVKFVTEATPSRVCSKGDNSRSWLLLYVVLPISGGFNLLLVILTCIVVYRWRKRQRKVQMPEIMVTNNNTRATQDYLYTSMPSSNDGDSSYTPMNLNSPGNQRLVVPSQANVEMRTTTTFTQSQNSVLYENERARSGDSTALYANASLRGSRHNNIARQPQQQQEQQQTSGSNKEYNIYVNECFPHPPQAS